MYMRGFKEGKVEGRGKGVAGGTTTTRVVDLSSQSHLSVTAVTSLCSSPHHTHHAMTSSYPSPSRIPLPPSPSSRRSSDHSISSRQSQTSERSTSSLRSLNPLLLSPTAPFRPRLDRNFTSSATIRLNPRLNDPFYEGSTISVNQPVGSLSISPSSRDVCLASRKGLYILDIANLHNAPRFIPQGGTWQIAE